MDDVRGPIPPCIVWPRDNVSDATAAGISAYAFSVLAGMGLNFVACCLTGMGKPFLQKLSPVPRVVLKNADDFKFTLSIRTNLRINLRMSKVTAKTETVSHAPMLNALLALSASALLLLSCL
jgi:hypothetical protein